MSIHWGIIGAGNIAHRFAASLRHQPDSTLMAISGRNAEKLEQFANKFNVEKIYLDHEQLLNDPNISAVYISLPHELHKEWVLKSIEYHKPVLCEKPLALFEKDVVEIQKASNDRKVLVMEAMKTKFIPGYIKMKELIMNNQIGELKSIETAFCTKLPDEIANNPNKYINQITQGGALYDVGCYETSFFSDFITPPFQIDIIDYRIKNGIDTYVHAKIIDAKGIACTLHVGIDVDMSREGVMTGSKGSIILDQFHRPSKLTLINSDLTERIFDIPYENDDFYGQIDSFCKAIRNKEIEIKEMTLLDSVKSAKLIDLIKSLIPNIS